MKGRLSKKGAENLGAPELAGKVVDYGAKSPFNTVSVSYRGEYLGRISSHRITPIKTQKKKASLFKKIFG
jgi:hypothetical protein